MKLRIWGSEGDRKSTLDRILGIKNGAENGAEKKRLKNSFWVGFWAGFGSQKRPKTAQKTALKTDRKRGSKKGPITTYAPGLWNGRRTRLDGFAEQKNGFIRILVKRHWYGVPSAPGPTRPAGWRAD